MKSKDDPILDLQAICAEKPSTKAELEVQLKALGWGIPFSEVFSIALGTYIEQGPDGLYVSRNGTVSEVVQKTLR
jgi:hypothetical protein